MTASNHAISIRPAERAGARALLVFAGVSGSGKTYSALQFAYGLAGNHAAKIGLLDTENRRGSLYAEALELASPPTKDRFLIGDLVAPFSPERYTDAVMQFQDAGVEVLVIDSGTHEWEGPGGCDDIANAPDSRGNPPRMARWNQAKREHKRFVNALLQCDMHVIVCLRAREKSKPGKDENGKLIYETVGIQPICEKNFMFEATASILLHDAGTRHDRVKVPRDLERVFPGSGYITSKNGAAFRQWIAGVQQLDPKVEQWRNRLLANAEEGERHTEACWCKVPEPIQKALGEEFRKTLMASAAEYDRQARQREEPEAVTAINSAHGLALDFGREAGEHRDDN